MTSPKHLGWIPAGAGASFLASFLFGDLLSLPTLVTANPVASPLTHVFLHVAAVAHSPETDLFLPPHRE